MRILLSTVLLLSCACSALAWGAEGHSAVARIAQSLFQGNTSNFVFYYIPDAKGDLGTVANWADQVRSTPQWSWSAPLHYIDTPDWACGYERKRDCPTTAGQPDFCVDGAIQNYTKQSADSKLDADDRGIALKFITHFIGDIHQPLHVGFTTDAGGNTEKGSFNGHSSVTLHSIWDTYIIQERLVNDFGNDQAKWTANLETLLATKYAVNVTQWLSCAASPTPYGDCSDAWAVVSAQLACQYAYVGADGVTPIKNGFSLGQDYYQRNIDIVEMLIIQAGVRLGAVLNNVANSAKIFKSVY